MVDTFNSFSRSLQAGEDILIQAMTAPTVLSITKAKASGMIPLSVCYTSNSPELLQLYRDMEIAATTPWSIVHEGDGAFAIWRVPHPDTKRYSDGAKPRRRLKKGVRRKAFLTTT